MLVFMTLKGKLHYTMLYSKRVLKVCKLLSVMCMGTESILILLILLIIIQPNDVNLVGINGNSALHVAV